MTELQLHGLIVDWLRLVLPGDALMMHSPNEGMRTRWERGQLDRLGVRAGWPDLALYWQGRAIFLEVKTEGGSLTQAQRATILQLQRQGFTALVVRSIEDVREVVIEAGWPIREAGAMTNVHQEKTR